MFWYPTQLQKPMRIAQLLTRVLGILAMYLRDFSLLKFFDLYFLYFFGSFMYRTIRNAL